MRLSLETEAVTRANVLLLCDDDPKHANTVQDHIRALRRFSAHRVRPFNPIGRTRARFLDIDEFDAIVVHYSIVLISDHYLPPWLREDLRDYRGPKLQFIQDEYRWVDRTTQAMRDIGIGDLFTVVPRTVAEPIYAERLPGVRLHETLTGYVPHRLIGRAVPPIGERPLHVAYRGRELPYWLGRLSQEKVWIAQGVAARAEAAGLLCDLGWREADRIYGRRWDDFMTSGRATLGTESGASIIDFDGSAERAVLGYLSKHPEAEFAEVANAVLRPYEGQLVINTISPRVFEAAALRTALVLFPGEYTGLIEPDRHYIPLAKDFSNFDEVAARLRDDRQLESMTQRAYTDLIDSRLYSEKRLGKEFDHVISSLLGGSRTVYPVRYALARGFARARAASAFPLRWSFRFGRRRFPTSTLRRLAHDPRGYGLRAWAVVRALGSEPNLRRLLFRYLVSRSARSGASLDLLLEDLLKLRLLQRAVQGRLPGEPAARGERQAGDDVLVFRSGQPAGPAWVYSEGELPSRLRWDHSRLGKEVLVPVLGQTVAIHLGERGIHEFRSFPTLAQLAPDAVRRLLKPATGG